MHASFFFHLSYRFPDFPISFLLAASPTKQQLFLSWKSIVLWESGTDMSDKVVLDRETFKALASETRRRPRNRERLKLAPPTLLT